MRKELFDFFIGMRSSLKARLPEKIFLERAESLYRDSFEWKRKDVKPEMLSFSNRWLEDWCKEYQISIKKPSKRFFITARARKKIITDFLKKIWTCRYTFTKIYGVDPEIVMSDQMPLHENESSNEKTLSFKSAPQTTYVKENYSLSRKHIIAMT